jgi:hypothetical protein
MAARITVRLDETLYTRLLEASRHRAIDASAFVRQALRVALEPAAAPPAPAPSPTPPPVVRPWSVTVRPGPRAS